MTNFIHRDSTKHDIHDMFGDCDDAIDTDEVFIPIDEKTTMEEILVDHLKKFPSRTQARKNGFSGTVPIGFKQHRIGKMFFLTWMPTDHQPVGGVKFFP